jgi:hypothetical protein
MEPADLSFMNIYAGIAVYLGVVSRLPGRAKLAVFREPSVKLSSIRLIAEGSP